MKIATNDVDTKEVLLGVCIPRAKAWAAIEKLSIICSTNHSEKKTLDFLLFMDVPILLWGRHMDAN